jgi:signal transduction histidine kinase
MTLEPTGGSTGVGSTEPSGGGGAELADVVLLACHDLRTPLATVSGFAKTILNTEELDERTLDFVALIDGAAGELADLIDLVAVLARIETGRYDPVLAEADTLGLAGSDDSRIASSGTGAAISTDVPRVKRSLEALAVAAARHGGVPHVAWAVQGRELELTPVTAPAAPAVTGEEPLDLGAIVARRLIEALGGSLSLVGETLRVTL